MIHEHYKELTEKGLKELAPEIEGWKEQYGDVHLLAVELDEGDEFQGIFRVPNEKDVKLSMRKDLSEMESQKELLRMTVLYPDVVTFNLILAKYWGLSIPLARKLIEICHVTKETKIKKL